MTKTLKPYTLIPTDLYVHRDADRQLQSIITDMGRPGYVLVSRQMGKTNLLLNAKRELQTSQDIFLYIDLSNRFDDARSCFESIIDTAIETNEMQFTSISSILHNRRRETPNIPPHKQHLSELRLLLSCITGKLVIILDEIDALAKTEYSDLIFAQIRSIYFSRVNFGELNRLTYILSGVIEPIEIIKDPKISPFNIGQKIYLNDFTKNEFESFLLQAKLTLASEISDRIFFWTYGNPRMTWDVCSEIESLMLDRQLMSVQTVDMVVNELYLKSYDKPPIDNIRELVKNDREIRNAVVEIAYKKEGAISDKIKNKLYLSGIINYEENKINIKNEVIKRSLNLEWIRSLELQEKGQIRVALEYYEKGDYKNAINSFETFLAENDFDSNYKSDYHLYLAEAYYAEKDYEKSLVHLNHTSFEIDDQAALYYRTLNILGTVYYNLDRIPESLEKLRIVIDSGRKDKEYARALINYGVTLLKSAEYQQHEEAIQIFEKIIDESSLKKEKLSFEFIQELKSISYKSLAKIELSRDNRKSALEHYKHAISLSAEPQKPSILLSLYNISQDSTERHNLLKQLIDILVKGITIPNVNALASPAEFTLDEFKYVVLATFADYKNTLYQEIKPLLHLLGEEPNAKIIYDTALYVATLYRNWDLPLRVINELRNSFEDSEFIFGSDFKFEILKVRAFLSDLTTSNTAVQEYFSAIQDHDNVIVDHIDLEIFSTIIFKYIEQKKIPSALKYSLLINKYKTTASEGTKINYLIIHNLELSIYSSIKDIRRLRNVASTIIDMTSDKNLKLEENNLLGEKGLRTIVDNAKSFLPPEKKSVELAKTQNIYERNQKVLVKYHDGKTEQVKYKKIEKDLKDGLCVIIN